MTNFLAFGLPVGGEWLIILAIVIILFGATKIPALAKSMGKSIKEFKKGVKEGDEDNKSEDTKKTEEKKEDNQ